MKKIKQLLIRNAYVAVAIELCIALCFSILPLTHAAAAGQLSSRSVQMSDSAPSGGTITSGVGSGTKVAYKFTFSPVSAGTVGAIVIDFCSNSALFWDTCTAPTGLNTNRSTTTAPSGSQSNLGTGAMSVDTTGTNYNNSIVISRATPGTLAAGASFELGTGISTGNGITNPSTTGSFYARIYTYDTAAHARSHNPGSTTDDTYSRDFGGVALSTANVITITARVQENLTFCVSLAAPTSNCGGTSTPAVTLGHGTNAKIIDSSAVDANSAYTQISTNAGSGAIVRMHNAYTCGGLSADAGTSCGIPPTGSGSATAAAITAGTSAFGLYVAPGSALSGGTGTVTPDANYYNAAHTTISSSNPDLYFGMDTTTSGNNVTTTYGDPIESCTAPVSNVNSQLVFAATASNVAPAGLYSTNVALIATGTF